MNRRILYSISLLLLFTISAYAQYPEDALRLGESSYGMSARSVSMGNAMTGLAQGYDAVLYNPAGLAQSRQSEFSFGLNFLGNNNDASYLGSSNSLSRSQTDITNVGIVYPFPTLKGSFVVAFGYNRGADFNSALSVKGTNRNSSIIPSLYYPGDTLADISYMVFLEDASQNPLVTKDVYQSGQTFRSGGLNNWLASAAIDVAQDFSLGLTLNLISGSYQYNRTFTESAIPGGVYGDPTFSQFVLSDQDNQDITGWNAKFGFLYRMRDESGNVIARVGAAINFPSYMTITDNYSSQGTATFTAGGNPAPYSTSNGYGESESGYPGPALQYDVTTPFKFSVGVSGGSQRILASADIEYTDWTQLDFSNSNLPASVISNLNSQVKQSFTSTTNFRAGLEIALANPNYSLTVPYVRVGGSYLPSPYANDKAAQAQKFLSGGLGFRIQNSIVVDLAYQYGWWETSSLVYPGTTINNVSYIGQSTSNEKVTNTNFLFSFKYDF